MCYAKFACAMSEITQVAPQQYSAVCVRDGAACVCQVRLCVLFRG